MPFEFCFKCECDIKSLLKSDETIVESEIEASQAAGDGAVRFPGIREDDASEPHPEKQARASDSGDRERHERNQHRLATDQGRRVRVEADGGKTDRVAERVHLLHAA